MSIFGPAAGQQSYPRRSINGRWVIAGLIALVTVVGYLMKSSVNPVTGQKQHISMTPQQEIAMGLQAAPGMTQEFGGLDPDPAKQGIVQAVGQKIASGIPKATETYPFEFHLLVDPKTVNAFALPGGQVFITHGLFDRLTTEGELAGVLGHEIGHVVERHSAEHLAKSELVQGLSGAAAVGATDPSRPGSAMSAMMIAGLVSNMVNLKYGRDDELEADRDGVRFMAEAGYDPRSMVKVMQVLKEATGGSRQPEFMSSHPDPGNRIEKIEAAIKAEFPNGVPPGLKQ
jgi:predicted Zn-dependent protease